AARSAFQSLLVLQQLDDALQQRNSSQRFKSAMAVEFRRRSVAKYNSSYAPGNDLINLLLDGYIAIRLLGKVLNETWQEDGAFMEGRRLADRFLNRTFSLENIGDVYVDWNGIRKVSNAVMHYNALRDIREPFLVRYANTSMPQTLTPLNVDIAWLNIPWPPPWRPRCGYRGDSCLSDSRSMFIESMIGISTIVVIGAALAVKFWRWFQHYRFEVEHWWILQPRDLRIKGLSYGRSRLSLFSLCQDVQWSVI
ncbi:hypothetical protein BV898_13971, partial [Hypsibius exemplaris]